MIVLRVLAPEWVGGDADVRSADLCAHGRVELRVNGEAPRGWKDLQVTVSAAALFLMRTLEPGNPVCGEGQMFPCCGHTMYVVEGERDVLVLGCPTANTIDVRHFGSDVELDLGVDCVHRVSLAAWTAAVFTFADQVSSYYASSPPRELPADPELRAGYLAFQHEWARRRGRSLGAMPPVMH